MRIPSIAHNYSIKLKPFIKPIVFAFAILLIATFAIWRTNLPYIDDINRDYYGGYSFSYAFARHSSSLLMYFLNMDLTLQNLSPLTQILAMLFVAIACVIIAYILCNRRIRYLPLAFSTLIAINPLALGCWMFQYDSPGMALSILSAALPILFWYKLDGIFSSKGSSKRKRNLIIKFIVLSSLSLVVMWTSYQSSSGLLPLLVLTIVFVDILRNVKVKPTILKALLYVIPYLIAAGLFLAIYNLSSLDSYRDASTAPVDNLLPAIVNNLRLYLSTPWEYLNGSWRILVTIAAISFILSSIAIARKKIYLIRNGLLSIIYLVIALPLSYGAYIVLNSPASGISSTFGRTAVGLGFVIALVCTITTVLINSSKSVLVNFLYLPGFAILIAFVSYNTAFANAYDDQLRYIQFRVNEVVTNIADIYPSKKSLDKKHIFIYNTIGYSGEMQKLMEAHPIAKLITEDFHKGFLPVYFGKMQNFSRNIRWQPTKYYKQDCANSSEIDSTYYHTISEKGDGDICVYLENRK